MSGSKRVYESWLLAHGPRCVECHESACDCECDASTGSEQMPTRPPIYGARPSGQRRRYRDTRESAARRGYDETWRRLRSSHLMGEPWCRHCLHRGLYTPATEVDHIVEFSGVTDAKRLDTGNLQSLCKSCHSRKTRAS